jgi:hypothetical protein
LRSDPVATVIDSCVGCGVCGEVAHAAVLCPSFYKARIVSNPTAFDRVRQRLRGGVIGWLQRRDARRRSRFDFPMPELPADPGRRAAAPSQAPGAVPPRVDSASVEPRPGSSEAPRERVLR